MSNSNAILVVVIGLLILWLGITGKFDCFSGTLNCMLQKPGTAPADKASGSNTGAAPATGALNRVLNKTGPQYRFPGVLEALS